MTEQAIGAWITNYGYIGIFALLIFGIVGLPVPDEWLLVLSGYLVFKDVLSFTPTVAVAVGGSIVGLTVSYALGRTSGGYVLRRYGRWLSLTEEKLLRTQQWFQNFGRWTLVVGPFIPGIRNLMGYVAGASRLKLHVFARFAYLGAFVSALSFVTFGYVLGRHGRIAYSSPAITAVAVAGVIGVALVFRKDLRTSRNAAAETAMNPSRCTDDSTQAA